MGTIDEQLLDLDWLSGYLGIPQRSLYNWRQRGEGPPAYRVGKHLRYRRSDIEAWLDSRRDDKGPSAA
jgi:excisionase family DNA binding protein